MKNKNGKKQDSNLDLNDVPLDFDIQEFIDSIDAAEEMKEFICQPLHPDPFLKYSFPFYEESLKNTLAFMPRQSFGNDFAADKSLTLVQEIGQGQLTIKWTLSVPFIKEKTDGNIPDIFYKIERFVIRPKIRDLISQNNLRRAVSLSKLSEIAERTGLSEKEVDKIIEALEYGSQIKLRIRIESTRKRYEETNLCEEKLFKLYNIHFSTPVKISNKYSADEKSTGKLSKFTNESFKANSKPIAEKIIIYPSPTYLSVLLAVDETLSSSLEDSSTRKTSSLNLRIQEIKSLLVASSPNISFEQTSIIESISALIPIAIEDLLRNDLT